MNNKYEQVSFEFYSCVSFQFILKLYFQVNVDGYSDQIRSCRYN